IHRLTLGRLRREIEAVPAADFMRFLFRWQHIQPGSQLHGRDGVLQIIGQLQGMELPAPAWEEHVIPARVRLYDPADLEHLCLSGTVTWGRLSAGAALNREPVQGATITEEPSGASKRRQGPGRNSPIAFVLREDLPVYLCADRASAAALGRLSSAAGDVAWYLQQHGASFMPDIVKGTRRLPAEVEDALWELVAHGVVSGDGVAGLRQLLHGGGRHRDRRRFRAYGAARSGPYGGGLRTHGRSLPVGRWSLWHGAADVESHGREDAIARQLLRRYGVVVRDLVAREPMAPGWRGLLGVYRLCQVAGETPGGSFGAVFAGRVVA